MRAKLQFLVWWMLWTCSVMCMVCAADPVVGPPVAGIAMALTVLYLYVKCETDDVIEKLSSRLRGYLIIAIAIGVCVAESSILLYILGPTVLLYYYYEEVPKLGPLS